MKGEQCIHGLGQHFLCHFIPTRAVFLPDFIEVKIEHKESQGTCPSLWQDINKEASGPSSDSSAPASAADL